MPDVVCLGEVIVDMIATDRDAGLDGTRSFDKFPGGATANVAVGVCRMGGSSRFLGVVANDAFGRFLIDALLKEGVDVSRMRRRAGERTVIGFIALRSDQTKEVIFYRDPQSEMFLTPDELAPDAFCNSVIFHFGIICLSTKAKLAATRKALQIARMNNLLTSLDVNYRSHAWQSSALARKRLIEVLPSVDILKMAEEEIPLLFGGEMEEGAVQKILAMGVKAIIISRGANGATLVTHSLRMSSAGFPVRAAETTGAGDAFIAAVLVSLTKKRREGKTLQEITKGEWEEILRHANAAGALTCTRAGAMTAIPTHIEIVEFLSNT